MTERQRKIFQVVVVVFVVIYTPIFIYLFGFRWPHDLIYVVAGVGGVCLAALMRKRHR